MNEFVFNSINKAAGSIQKLKLAGRIKKYDLVVASDEHPLSYLLCGTLMILKNKYPNVNVCLLLDGQPRWPESLAPIAEQWPELQIFPSVDAYLQERSDRDVLYFDFANLRHASYEDAACREQKLSRIGQILDDCARHPGFRYQLITCIPGINDPLPTVTNAIAEREYEVIFRDKPANSLEKFVIRLENVLRGNADLLDRTQVIRLDRVYGPGICIADDTWVLDVIRDIFTEKTVTVYDRDRHDIASAVCVRDAIVGILIGMLSGRMGNIYHVSSHSFSRFQIISNLFSAFPECDCTLETVHEGWNSDRAKEYRILNARKLRLAHSSKLDKVLSTPVVDALKETARWYQGIEGFVPSSETSVYYGRMPRIREIELRILDEVDAICKKHNINYFLTAGTMLGAVRHGEFIPWDDDVDIGMLPEDYKRFLEVCPDSLSLDYGYQNFKTELTSHYIHDKIRVKNSFFSTKYSNQYPMLNGVYIDVFVYFKTSDVPALQKFHLWYINVVRRLIGMRWADRPRKGHHYYLSKVALPIMRLFSFTSLHNYYIHVLSWFEKRNTHYRVDSMGFNLKKVGAVPDEWFHGTVDATFCGKTYPILEHYNDFLSHWYGQRYMELLPVSGRKSVHDVVRIDLGQNLFDETMHDNAFRDVDLRGELYETYKQTTKED